MVIKRRLEESLRNTQKSILLLGPRQTGKSTLLTSLSPDLVINLAREDEFLRLSTDPGLFGERIEDPRFKLIFIDEIQRIPSLLNTIQAVIDESKGKKKKRFLISGSSARKLRKGSANLLPGRVLSYQLSGFSAQELNYTVNLNRVQSTGFLPEAYLEGTVDQATKLLTSYSATYLREEIQAEALTRNVQGFARFLRTMAESSGNVLDFSKLATKSKVSRSSLIRFVEILEDTLVAQVVPVFEEATSADTIKHSKFYFFDVGVWNGILENFSTASDRKGILFEHLLFSQIRNSLFALDLPPDISYFRTRSGVEVDFIVKIKGKVWALEAKTGDVSQSDLRGLRSFKEYFPKVTQCITVTPSGARRRTKDGILICDWMTALQEMGL